MTPVSKLREKWEQRWAPMWIRIGSQLCPCVSLETTRHVLFFARMNGSLFEVEPGQFRVMLWVYRG